MLCGTNERRLEMIQNFQPIDRIFEILDLKSIEKDEMGEFFKKSFENANYKIAEDALGILCNSSDGFPKLMNLIGDATYWMDKDGFIDKDDAITGIMEAADQLGKQSIDEQILKAMKSEDYHKILSKLVKMQLSNLSFKKADLQKLLSSAEEKKLNNFLTKMKSFDVLKPGDKNGEYVFTSQMMQLYIFMNSLRKEKVSKS
jgi:hypothetical protein